MKQIPSIISKLFQPCLFLYQVVRANEAMTSVAVTHLPGAGEVQALLELAKHRFVHLQDDDHIANHQNHRDTRQPQVEVERGVGGPQVQEGE